MVTLATPSRNNGANPGALRRASLADAVGLEPLDLFRNFYSPFALNGAMELGGLDISRTETGYVVEIPVPGYKPTDIEITFKDEVLSISGKSERRTFTRSLVLPDEIDPENVQARVEHGLLTLNLSRRPEAEPKHIKINVSDN
jgi:HSP20 family protein